MHAPAKSEVLPLGVHIGLPEEQHHADPGIGSTRLRRLIDDVSDFWWYSPMNPKAPNDTTTKATDFGTASHKLVLEGPASFKKSFVRRPDDAPGATPAEKGATTKAFKAKLKTTETMLHGEEYDRVLGAHDAIKLDPELAEAFSNGIPEVSIFFEIGGVRCKARIDYMRIKANVDLKNITVTTGSFPRTCLWRMQHWYDSQFALYQEGRRRLRKFLEEGKVWGEYDKDLLAKMAAFENPAFVFVFLRANSAPITFARRWSDENPLTETARAKVAFGLSEYARCSKEYGSKMWLKGHKMQEVDQSEFSPYYGYAGD